MGFWIFMTAMNLLLPFIMIVIGHIFIKNPPKEINHLVGYRTTMSMKNKDTWEFAHHHCGKNWKITGLCMLIPSALVMLAFIGKDTQTVGKFGSVVIGVQTVILLASIIPTETALRKNFDKDGNRIKI
ncbi:SdpI family protein [Lacrimispora defluvii]|uniref:SdpI family protein n=1 Tax=Lacrimispora defluvii TaxID=2719233 RepID=A0ABX1VTH0_9FIRM|nr:SdpI family protein [Lacrimispora defluvii]NNJ31069.1 SdpI family protein [Lacrimispora defluvii]